MEKEILKARIISEHKGLYKARSAGVDYLCKVTGKRVYDATSREDFPAVGDWINISIIDGNNAVIDEILPRKTILRKRSATKKGTQIIATNVDVAFITESLSRDYNLNRFERYLVMVKDENITPTLIINKIDTLPKDVVNEKLKEVKDRFPNVDVLLVSAITGEGVEELRNYIKEGMTYCFLGSSGVGKSSLINALLNTDEIKVREISLHSDRGKHTTTTREMYYLDNGGFLIDNPGTREVGIASIDIEESDVFTDLEEIAKDCKYADCSHTHEPGCAILKSLKENQLDTNKYNNYMRLRKEEDHYTQDQVEKRSKDKKFGKFVKNTMKDVRKIKGLE